MNSPVNPFAVLEGILTARANRDVNQQQADNQRYVAEAGLLSRILNERNEQARFQQTQGRLEKAQAQEAQFRNAQLQAAAQGRQEMMNAARERDAMRIKAAQEALKLRGAGTAPRPVYDPARGVVVDPATGTAKPVMGADGQPLGPKASEKALPPGLQKQLTEAAELADATNRFATTFQDNFGGKTFTGSLGNTAGRILGDETGQSQWWQDYELHQSQIRNKLFGSALTKTEVEAWNKSAINPRMNSKQIRENLERRSSLEQTGLERLIKGTVAGKYNKEQIEAFTGRNPDNPAPPSRRASDKPNPGIDALLEKYK